MRVVYEGSGIGTRKTDGRDLQPGADLGEVVDEQHAKSVRPITRINGHRIHFRELAFMAFPQKTDANLAFIARVDVRTARRWLSDDTEPPAAILGVILAEIMKRFHQRD